MNVFLTGATGFIGSHLARKLVHEGSRVFALIRPGSSVERIADIQNRLNILKGDLKEPGPWVQEIERIKPEISIHAAWITTPGVYLKSPENYDLLTASLKLAEHLSSAGCQKLISLGTCFEYDTNYKILSETTPTCPRTIYSTVKLELLRRLEAMLSGGGMKLVWPRLFYLYGPGENSRRLIPALIRSFLTGSSIDLTSGDKVRDYLHVEDVVSAIWSVVKNDLQGPVNIGSGTPITIQDLADLSAQLAGKAATSKFGALPDDPLDPKHVVADNRRLLETGWTPAYTLESGLRQTIDYWKGRIST